MQYQPKAVILARVSGKSQEDGYSLDAQTKLMRRYCKTKNLSVIKEFIVTETASKEQRRKIFHEMVLYITTHKAHHLIVEKTDRLTRNFKDATTIDSWLEHDDKRMLHMVKENLVLHKNARSDAKFMWNIYLSVAKKYTDNLREEAMKGWAEKLAQGWLPHIPPPGYMTVVKDGKKIHVPNPEVYKLMPRIFQLALLPGYTRARLSQEMLAMGITTRRGKPFSISTVSNILTNPFYIGINRLDGKEYPGAQEPIIKKALFNAVQKKLQGKHSQREKSRHNPIFKSMILCSACGYMISWSVHKGRFYGSCGRRKQECRGKKFLREDRVQDIVVQKLDEVLDPSGKILTNLKAALQITCPQDVGYYRLKMIDELSKQIVKLKRMDSLIYEDKLNGVISEERYLTKQQQFQDETQEATERLEILREAQQIAKPVESVIKSDNQIVNLYLNSSPSQKRTIMATIFESITADGEKVILSLK